MIKILVIRQGRQRSTNSIAKSIRKLIFVDEQGTKIHGIIFSSSMDQFKDKLKINRSCFITNPTIMEPSQKFPTINQQFELVLHRDTIVTEIETHFERYGVKSNFKEFADLEMKCEGGHEIDIIGILKKVKQIYRFERKDKSIGYRREVILINTLLETITINLWDDLAFNEGQYLHETEMIHPVVAFLNVKIQSYQGAIQLMSTTTSGMFLHPFCNETKIINSWLQAHVNEQTLEEMWMKKRIKDSKEVTLSQLLNERHSLQESTYYYIKARVHQVENRASPWYEACNNCTRAVARMSQGNNCLQCAEFNIQIIPRYRLAIMVEQEDFKARLTLFEKVAAVYIGIPENEYIRLLTQNNTQYQSILENPDDGEHKFLFKLDKNVQVKNEVLSIIVDGVETPSAKYKTSNVLGEKRTSRKEQDIDTLKHKPNPMGKKNAIISCKKNGKERQWMAHEQTTLTELEDNDTIGSFMKRKRQISKKKEATKSSEKHHQRVVKVAQQSTIIKTEEDEKIPVSNEKRKTAGVKKIGKSRVVKNKKEKL